MDAEYKNRISIQSPANKISVTFHYGGEALTPSEQREVMDEMANVAKQHIKRRNESPLTGPQRIAAKLKKLAARH